MKIHDAAHLCNWRIIHNLSGVSQVYGNFIWAPRVTCKLCRRRKKAQEVLKDGE